jgi:hypothetical protein
VIRADLGLLDDRTPTALERAPAPLATRARIKTNPKTSEHQTFPPAPASLCSTQFLRADPRAAGVLRARVVLQNAAAPAKLLRLNADAAAPHGRRLGLTFLVRFSEDCRDIATAYPRGPWLRDGTIRPPRAAFQKASRAAARQENAENRRRF